MPKTPGKPRAQGATPKKRWTADQKQARDASRPPVGKGAKSTRRPSADAPRGSRPERTGRDDRAPRGDRADRADRPTWGSRDDRGSRYADRPQRASGDRDDRGQGGRPQRAYGDRPYQRDDRAPYQRDDRVPSTGSGTGYRGRDDRAPYQRDDRRPYQRDDRPAYRDRPERPYQRDDRGPSTGSGTGYGARDDRRPYQRDDRQPYQREDRRPSYQRDDRPAYRDRDDRPYRRDDRPYQRDDRPYRDRDDRREPPFRRGPEGRHHYQPSRPGDRAPRRQESFAKPESDHMEWVARRHEKVEQVQTGFSDLGLPDALVNALAADGITTPFPIQAATIADGLAGRDLLGRAKTGSGKTLGFGLPMLARLADEPGGLGVRGLVLVPTRELALQVADVLAPLAQALGLSCALVAGGMAYGPQLRAFERGVDVVVATPGRLIDLMEQGAADLSQVMVTVLDEADHMADLGFWPAVTTIVDATPRDGQRLLFSATLDEAIDALVKRYLTDPVIHEVDPDTASVGTMTHAFWVIAPHHKNELTARVAGRGRGRTLVFVRTQMGADRVATQLRAAGVMAGALHGGLSQGARSRILTAFKEGELPVLVATDVAARGIHVDDVSLVLQLDPPMTHKDYLHRAGRTARAGESGTVVSFVLPHQRRTVLRLAGMAGTKPKLEQVDGDAEAVEAVAGAVVDRTPIAEEDYAALVAPKQVVRRPRPAKAPFRRDRGYRR